MRMKNPFASDPGDESERDAQASDDQPESRGDEEEQRGPEMSETRASETRESESPSGGETRESESPSSDESDADEQELTAPSVGPHTKIEKEPPEERLDFDQISDTDAMGKDKRREVVGGTYGPTRTRVIATFATFFAVVAALAVGFYFLAKELDQPPSENPDEAPWSASDAPQKPPKPLQ